jgi:phosphopantothenoylcysteine decarboxylase/phosphopantothenate--cysteine ligase
MGYALARAAKRYGRVTLVSGPTALAAPSGVKTICVQTAAEMARAVLREARGANVVIQCAAVADFTAVPRRSKIKKRGKLTLKLKRTLDIAARLGQRKKRGQILVGFAAETENVKRHALKKLRSKKLDFIVANRVSKNAGFDSDYNEVILISRDGSSRKLKRESKIRLARKLLPFFLP